MLVFNVSNLIDHIFKNMHGKICPRNRMGDEKYFTKNSKESKLVLTNLLHCILDPVKESSFDLLDFVSAYFSELLEQVLLF